LICFDPSGVRVHVVAGTHPLEPLPSQTPHTLNLGHELLRVNADAAPAARTHQGAAARAPRAADHRNYLESLNWYLDNLGMIVSDFLYFPGQRDADQR